MLVLIADKFEQSGLDGLKAIGCEISYQAELKDDTLVAAIGARDHRIFQIQCTVL